jgi:hypothetical protein
MAEKDLNRLATAGGKAEKATDGLTSAFARYVSVAAVVATATGAVLKLIDVQREFDKINAGLVTATGSAGDARIAFEALQDFATKTPYDLAQVSEAFIQLVNRGLDPSERALTSYGNTASGMGKNLEEMVRAVAQATTGEFESMKQFGVSMKKVGDDVAITFRGVTTTVANNTQQIEDYFIKMGEANFGGAMDERMKTLDGAMSNLGDEWDKLFLNISQSGIGDSIADTVRMGIDALSELNDFVASGQFEGYLEAMGAAWGPWKDDAQQAMDIVVQSFSDYVSEIDDKNPDLTDALYHAWREFPENVRAMVQLATVYFAHELEDMKARATGFAEQIKAIFTDDTIDAAAAREVARIEANNKNYSESIDLILAQRDASIKASDAAVQAADKARVAYEKEKAAKAGDKSDRLAKYGLGVDTPDAPGGKDKDAERAARKLRAQEEAQKREFDSLVDSLRTEEEAINASYAKRLELIVNNTAKGSEAQSQLIAKLDKDKAEQLQRAAANDNRELDQLQRFLQTEEDSITESYDKRTRIAVEKIKDPVKLQAMLEQLSVMEATEQAQRALYDAQDKDRALNTQASHLAEIQAQYDYELALAKEQHEKMLLSDEEYEQKKKDLVREYNTAISDDMVALWKSRLAVGEDMFAALADLAKNYGGEQSKAFKAMFAVQKAFTIASAAMDLQKAISAAMAMGWPQNIPLIAQAVAQGARILSTIQSISYSGAHDKGGFIPSGSIGTVAELGDEIVNGQLIQGPARVKSRRETEQLTSSGGGSIVVNINVVVQEGGASSTTSTSGEGDAGNARKLGQLIEEKTKDVLIREQRPGGLLYKGGQAA